MPVSKIIELIGSSTKSIEDAVSVAVSRASLTLKAIQQVEVTKVTATVEEGEIKEWKVEIRVAFRVLDQIHE